MMKRQCLHDKKEIERCLRKDVDLNIYALGDLDDFFWPYTTWYGFRTDGEISAIALMYTGLLVPTLVAFSDEGDSTPRLLLDSIRPLLPLRFYTHLSPGLSSVLETTHNLEFMGLHYKMALRDKALTTAADFPGIELLSLHDTPSIQELFRESYPGNWFDPAMLATHKYFGMKDNGRLVSIAGVHVYSKEYRVAALGNITTLPAYRGKGCAARVVTRLCRSLVEEGIEIGLNVKADNAPAISCYQKIGFQRVADYEEYLVTSL